MRFYLTFLTMAHWIRLSLLCRCKWTRKSQVSYENVSEQYLLFYEHKSVYCVYRRNLWSSIFVYGVLSLSMEFYLCLWSSIFVYGVLSLSTEFYLCLWSSIFVYGVLSLYMEFYLCLRSSIFAYGALFRWSSTFVYAILSLHIGNPIHRRR